MDRHSPLIDCNTLAAMLDNDDLVIVDCRFDLMNPAYGLAQYQHSHISAARYADLNKDLSSPVIPGCSGRHPLPEPAQFAETLAQWGISNNTFVVAYDDKNGMFACRLWWMLRWLGHERVAVLDGGLARWRAAGLPETAAPAVIRHAKYEASEQAHLRASVNQVEQAMDDEAVSLLDARGADRFRGENETIDPIGGHIPSAISVPFPGNLDDEGCFLSPEVLRQRYQPLLGSSETIVYCGSGVTAAHNILAMYHAGIDKVRLYDGSWSHWITDPARPIER